VPGSPRCVDLELASRLAEMARGRLQIVGVFRNQPLEHVVEIARKVRLDAVQLHGDESPQLCAQVPYPVWKAFGISLGWDPSILSRYKGLAARLFDTASGGHSGGTGKTFDWGILPLHLPSPWYLAGGLNLDNIEAALQQCQPDGLDLNSGLETSPGVKSPTLVARAMELVAPWREPPVGKPGHARDPMVLDGQSWPVWELPALRTSGEQEAQWVMDLLQTHGGRLVLDVRSRAGDPTEVLSSLMGLQMAARARGGRIKVRLSPPVMEAMLSASLASVLDVLD